MSCYNIQNLETALNIRNNLNNMFIEQYDILKRCNKSVATINERDNLPEYFRVEGMEVFVLEDSRKYMLVGGVENSNWVKITPSCIYLESATPISLTLTPTPQILDTSLVSFYNVDFTYDGDGKITYIGGKENVKFNIEVFLLMQATTAGFALTFQTYINSNPTGSLPIYVDRVQGITTSVLGYAELNNGDEIETYLSVDSGSKEVSIYKANIKLCEII